MEMIKLSKDAKYSTKILINILQEYKDKAPRRNKKISFSQVAEYARKELGYEDMRYYHFSRNEKINKKVKLYNNEIAKSTIIFSESSNKFISLDIEEFVKINVNNVSKLKTNMILLRDNFENLYGSKLEIEKINKDLKSELSSKSTELTEYKDKYKKKIDELAKLKQENKYLKIRLADKEEKQMLSALKSTKVFPIEVLNIEDEIDENIYESTENNGKNIKILVEELSAYSEESKELIEDNLSYIFNDIDNDD